MKISPMASAAASVGVVPPGGVEPAVRQARSLTFNTNATPGRAPPPPDATNSPIPDNKEGSPAASEETQPLSPQMAALAKARRALQLERQAFEKEKAENASKGPPAADMVTLADLKSDPLGILLNKAGLTYEDLTNAVVQNGAVDVRSTQEIAALKAEIAALKGDVDKRFTDERTQSEQQALAAMQREALQIVGAAGETYELVRETGSVPHAIKLIERVYRESGEVMDVREALAQVEEQLLEDMKKRMSLQKVQKAFAPPPPPAQQRQHTMRTLTNRDTAQAPLDRKARALAAFAGTLTR